MLTSAVIYKQRLLDENKIVQLLDNCKHYGVEQSHFRKPFCQERKEQRSQMIRSFLSAVQFVTGLNV